jgi:hypothetical protein
MISNTGENSLNHIQKNPKRDRFIELIELAKFIALDFNRFVRKKYY